MATEKSKLIFQVTVEDSQALSELKKLQAQAQTLKEEQRRLNKEYKAGNITLEQYSASTAELKLEQKAVSAEIRQTQKQVVAQTGSINEQRTILAKLTKQYNAFRIGIDGTEEDFVKLGKRTREVSDNLKELEGNVGDNRRSVGGYKDAILDSFSSIGDAATALSSGPLALVFAAQQIIAATSAAIDYTKQLVALRKEVSILTGETGEGLDGLTAKLQTIVSLYDQDFQETLLATNAVAQQFNISQQEAADIISKGFASGANASGEFLSILQEYPGQLNEIGLSADEAVAIFSQSVGDGAFSDKLPDLLKEANIRLRELTPAASDALAAIGISGDELQKQIQSGSINTFEAIQQVIGKMSDLSPTSKEVGKILADVMGSPGEDLPYPLLLGLADINTELDQVVEGAGEFAKAQLELSQVTEELNLELNKSLGGFDGVFTTIEIFVKRTLVNAIQGFKDFFAQFSAIGDAIRVVQRLFGSISDAVVKTAQRFGFLKEGIEGTSLVFTLISAPIKIMTLGLRQILQVIDFVVRRLDDLRVISLEAFNAIKEASNDFLGTDFQQTEIRRLIGVEEETTNNFGPEKETGGGTSNDDEGKEKEKTEEEIKKEREARKKRRELSLKDEKARINAELLLIEEGTKKQLELQKKALELERDLKLSNDKLTAGERLLIETEHKQKLEALDSQFKSRQLAGAIDLDKVEESLSIEQSLMQQRLESITALAEQEKQVFQETEEFKQEQRRLTNELEEQERQTKREVFAEDFQNFSDNALGIISTFSEAADNIGEARLNALEARQAREIAAVGDNEQAKAQIEAKFAKEKEALQKKQAQRRKIIAIAETIINTATSVVKTAADLGYPAAIPFQVLAGIIGVTNIAKIASQKFSQGGLATGPSHAQGGIPGFVPGYGPIEFEGGEFITNKRATGRNLDVLRVINDNPTQRFQVSPFALGGQIPIFQSGNVVPSSVTQAAQSRSEIAQLSNIIMNMPAPVVRVKDIRSGVSDSVSVEDRAVV